MEPSSSLHPHNYLALMCEGMDWELIEEDEALQPGNSPSSCVVGQECQYWESMEGPNNITNAIRSNSSNSYIMQDATYNSNNTAMPTHDFHEIVALDLLKVGMKTECNSSTNSMSMESNSCLNFDSMQKSSQKHIESPYLSLASNDYATNDAGILSVKSQGNLADDHVDVIDECHRIGSGQGGYDRMKSSKCFAKSSDDAEAGCNRVKSSEVCTEVNTRGTADADDHSNSELSHKEGCHCMRSFQENQSNSEASCKGDNHEDGRDLHKEVRGLKRKKGKASSMYKCKTREGHSECEAGEKLEEMKASDMMMQELNEAPHAHIFTERERRKKMKCLYDTLQSLLGLSTKADKATILEATISKIQMLENAKTLLLSQKAAKCRQLPTDHHHDDLHSENNNKKEVHQYFLQSNGTNKSIHDETLADEKNLDRSCFFHMRDPFGHVELHVSGSMGLFTISLQKEKAVSSSLHLPSVILSLLLNNDLEVLSAHISSSHDIIHYSLFTKAFNGSSSKRESFQIAYRELLCRLPT